MLNQFKKISSKIIDEIAKKYNISEDFAFEIFSLALLFEIPYDSVVADIWSGKDSRDSGFDGVFIDEENNILNLVQVKKVETLKDNDLGKIRTNYNEIFINGNKDNKPLSPEMQRFLDNYIECTRRNVILNPRLHFVYSGLNCKFKNEDVRERFSKQRNNSPKIEIYDFEYLYETYFKLQKNKRLPVKFTFNPVNSNIVDGQDLFSFAVGNVRATSFRIMAKQLCDLIDVERERNGMIDFLFSENIRSYLINSITNKNIKKTILDKSKARYFDLFNNGLTIISDEVILPESLQAGIYNVNVKNPVIVNGLQTSRVIYDVYKDVGRISDDIKVVIRLYEVKDQAVVDSITEATNTQSPINYRDKISNRQFNKYAKLFFEGENVLYISKRGELMETDTSNGLQDSVSSQVVLKFWYSTFYERPHIAKNSVNQVMKDLFWASEDNNLAKLFSGEKNSIIYSQMFNAYEIYRFVIYKRLKYFKESNYKRFGVSDFLLHSDELVSYGIYFELFKKEKNKKFNKDKAEKIYNDVIKNIKKIITTEFTRKGDSYSHNGYFKSERCLIDYNNLFFDNMKLAVSIKKKKIVKNNK